MGNKTVRKLKRIKIYEEYVILTGSFEKAAILGQMIYWSERVKDFDVFIEEENKRRELHGKEPIELQHGWIYKSAKQLSEETMLYKDHKTIRRYLQEFIKKGWLSERNNPNYKWDKTKQYRVNLNQIAEDLEAHGLTLPSYRTDLRLGKIPDQEGKIPNQESKIPDQESKIPVQYQILHTILT